jgi:DNA mismatch endonuclease Vsr
MSTEARSRIMSAIRKRVTRPELAVRRFLHGKGFRYRVHVSSLPGCPDLGFPSRRSVLFVHGCFWHRCLTRCLRNRVQAMGNKEVRSNVARSGTKIQFDVHDYPIIMFRNMKELREGISKRIYAIGQRRANLHVARRSTAEAFYKIVFPHRRITFGCWRPCILLAISLDGLCWHLKLRL